MTRDQATVDDFGREWTRFDQRDVHPEELRRIFDTYFAVFPWPDLPVDAVGADVGCGSGRWAALVAPRVGTLFAVDPSSAALAVAASALGAHANVAVVQGAAGELPVADGTLDFAYSLGVLHHTPDTAAALTDCVKKLKPGAPFLVYLYYAFDNRPAWFRRLWRISDRMRVIVSRLPFGAKAPLTAVLAAILYWPLARAAALAERRGRRVERWPLALYRNKSFYVMRNDSLDRFGTKLEQRFTAEEVVTMMRDAGLEEIEVSPNEPFWCVVGRRSGASAQTSSDF